MKCFSRPVVLAAMAVVCFATLAEAQPGRGQPGRGQPGGRPGPGGPMMMRGGFGGGGLLGLVRIEAIQEEIELLDDQKAQIDKLAEEMRPQRGEGDQRPDFRNMSDEERQKFFDEMRKRFEERAKTANEKLKKILLPHQIKRVEQISLQFRGTRALTDPEIAEKLKLTDAQKKKIEETMTANRESMGTRVRELFQGGGGDREKAREQFRKLREEADAKVLAVLTSDQKKQLEALKGDPFEMPEGGFGFRRGGFRGRGGEGGPGGREGRGRPGGEGGRGRGPRPSNN